MVELIITQDQIKRATDLYGFGILPNSQTRGEGNLHGALGEIVTYDYYKTRTETTHPMTFDYDLIIGGKKTDVKTKRCTSKPKLNYNCSVFDFNTAQDCEYYLFTRILTDMSKAWLLGVIGKADFYHQAEFKLKGEPDGQFEFTADCYNIPIAKLIPIT